MEVKYKKYSPALTAKDKGYIPQGKGVTDPAGISFCKKVAESGLYCTLDKGHLGNKHVAHGFLTMLIASWEVKPDQLTLW
jgi:hypothetical protein